MNKRLIAVFLILVVLLVFAGCNSKKMNKEITETSTITKTINQTDETEFVGVKNPFEDPNTAWLDESSEKETIEVTKPAEIKPIENKPNEPKPTEPKPTEPKPTEPKPTEPKPTESKPTEPKPTEPKPTEPKPTESEPTEPKADSVQTEYEKYMAMSGAEQKAYMESFGSVEAFFNWLTSAKAEHEALKPDIPIEDGKIDLG